MNTVIFSTGSNIGDSFSHLKFAEENIEKSIGEITHISKVYISEAWGNTEQQEFLNQVIVVNTKFSALQCLNRLQKIENERDRSREIHWGPRTLDIDILFFNEKIINTHKLTIPHPFIEKRLFVLLPLNEIYSSYIHPTLNKSIKQILTDCKDKSKVVAYKNGL